MTNKNKFPFSAILKEETFYAWCPCGRSSKIPFCDGSHKGTGFKPLVFKVEEEKEHKLCNCGNTKNAPYCDGTHKKLGKNT